MKCNLREIRTSRSLSLRQAGDLTDVCFKHLSVLERSNTNPSVRTALKIAKGFDLPVEAIWSLSKPGECYDN